MELYLGARAFLKVMEHPSLADLDESEEEGKCSDDGDKGGSKGGDDNSKGGSKGGDKGGEGNSKSDIKGDGKGSDDNGKSAGGNAPPA